MNVALLIRRKPVYAEYKEIEFKTTLGADKHDHKGQLYFEANATGLPGHKDVILLTEADVEYSGKVLNLLVKQWHIMQDDGVILETSLNDLTWPQPQIQ